MTSTLMTSFAPDVAWKNDVTLYHDVIFIILKVWKSYFQHQKLIRDKIAVFITRFAAKQQQYKNDIMLILH